MIGISEIFKSNTGKAFMSTCGIHIIKMIMPVGSAVMNCALYTPKGMSSSHFSIVSGMLIRQLDCIQVKVPCMQKCHATLNDSTH